MLRSFFHKLILSLAATALLLGGLEIGLRIWEPKKIKFSHLSQEYYTNPRGYYHPLRKEGRDTVFGLHYKKDSYGYRLPDESGQGFENIENAPNTLLLLGDSFTFGRAVKYKDLYSTRLGELLNRGSYTAAVKNRGVAGADVDELVEIYQREKILNPTLVLYGFVLNDFGPPPIQGYDFIDFNNGGPVFLRLRKASHLFNFICYLIDKKKTHDAALRGYLSTFQGENAEEKFSKLKQMNQSIKASGAVMVVILFPLLHDFEHYPFHEIHEKVAAFCRNENIELLDLLPAFSRHKAEDLWGAPNDQHPNERGHQIAAGEIFNFLTTHGLVKTK